jgi:hypothetical protein
VKNGHKNTILIVMCRTFGVSTYQICPNTEVIHTRHIYSGWIRMFDGTVSYNDSVFQLALHICFASKEVKKSVSTLLRLETATLV